MVDSSVTDMSEEGRDANPQVHSGGGWLSLPGAAVLPRPFSLVFVFASQAVQPVQSTDSPSHAEPVQFKARGSGITERIDIATRASTAPPQPQPDGARIAIAASE